jgi:SufS family cysteine desulfurase
MSIQRLDPQELQSPDAESAAPGDLFDTALISRLANELYSGSQGGAKTPAAPTAIAGVPGALPAGAVSAPPASIPSGPASAPAATPSNQTLTGGAPLAAPASSQPVHPASVRDSDKVYDHRSGAHDPENDDSYAFGEPRCSQPLFANSKKQNGITDSGTLFGQDAASTPEFYFLRGNDSVATSSLPGASKPAHTPSLSVLDIEAIRSDFPALHQKVNGKQLIWLDNAATTHKPQSVIDATSLFYGRDNSNIHRAAHTLAGRSTELFEAGREKVRQFLGAGDAKEIVFLRGTTEAINLVAQSYGRKNIGAGDEIILTEMEHHANIVPWQLLAEQTGAIIRVAPINDRGELIIEEFARLLGPRTKFVSVTHVSNALGTINPIEQIIPLAHARGVPVLVDGAQSTPHIPINVSALDADFFVFSAHKIFGPTGIGALYGKAHLLEQMPPWQGGGHMIRDVRFDKTTYQNAPEKFEAGTPDIAGVVGLGAAIDYITLVGIPAIAAYEHTLLEYATHALATVPGLRPIGTAVSKASVLSFVIPGISNEHIAKHLDKQGIAVRAGHHCAMPAQRHFGLETTVRPSLAFYNTFEEVDALVQALYLLKR